MPWYIVLPLLVWFIWFAAFTSGEELKKQWMIVLVSHDALRKIKENPNWPDQSQINISDRLWGLKIVRPDDLRVVYKYWREKSALRAVPYIRKQLYREGVSSLAWSVQVWSLAELEKFQKATTEKVTVRK